MWQCRQKAWQTASGSGLLVGSHKYVFRLLGFGVAPQLSANHHSGIYTTPNSDKSENERRIANPQTETLHNHHQNACFKVKGALYKPRRKGSLQSPHLQSTTAGQSLTAQGLGTRNPATRPSGHKTETDSGSTDLRP